MTSLSHNLKRKKWQTKQWLLSRDSIQGESLEVSRHNKGYCTSSTIQYFKDLVRINLSAGYRSTFLLPFK